MTVRINKKFLKDLSKIPVSDRNRIAQFVFEESEKIVSIGSEGIFENEYRPTSQGFFAKRNNVQIVPRHPCLRPYLKDAPSFHFVL